MKKSRVLFVLGLLVLGNCGEKGPEAPSVPKGAPVAKPIQSAPPQSIKQLGPIPQQGQPIVPAPVAPVEKTVPPLTSYDPRGKPDPFHPAEVLPDLKDGRKTRVLPLEQFEIADYELVGIVTGPGIKKAMLQDLSGKGYLVTVGTSIGKRGGKIIRIADREVIVEEPFQDFLGRKSVRSISLKLPKPQ